MENIFFFQTQQIHDNTNLFDQLKKQKIFYSYFKVDQNYYLFVYAQQSIDINLLYQSVEIIQELDYKQRKIRSFRGFFLYALEILENGKDYEILQTNLQPFFWRKVKNIIRQNKKSALQEFLFGKNDDSKLDNQTSNPRIKILEDQIQNLSNQVDSLQQKIIQLEHNQNILRETNLNVFSEAPKRPKIDSLTLEQGYFESKTVLEAPRSPLKPLSGSQEYNIPYTLKSRERP
jgi:hypothetical protein